MLLKTSTHAVNAMRAEASLGVGKKKTSPSDVLVSHLVGHKKRVTHEGGLAEGASLFILHRIARNQRKHFRGSES